MEAEEEEGVIVKAGAHEACIRPSPARPMPVSARIRPSHARIRPLHIQLQDPIKDLEIIYTTSRPNQGFGDNLERTLWPDGSRTHVGRRSMAHPTALGRHQSSKTIPVASMKQGATSLGLHAVCSALPRVPARTLESRHRARSDKGETHHLFGSCEMQGAAARRHTLVHALLQLPHVGRGLEGGLAYKDGRAPGSASSPCSAAASQMAWNAACSRCQDQPLAPQLLLVEVVDQRPARGRAQRQRRARFSVLAVLHT